MSSSLASVSRYHCLCSLGNPRIGAWVKDAIRVLIEASPATLNPGRAESRPDIM